MLKGGLVGVVFLVLALAGCASPTPQAGESSPSDTPGARPSDPVGPSIPGPIDEPPIPAIEASIDLLNCTVAAILMALPADQVNEQLPEGFTATSPAGGALATMHLDVYSCEFAVIENATVIQEASLAYVRVDVSTEDDWSQNATTVSYMFEVFASDAALVDTLARQGMLAIPAEIRLEFSDAETNIEVAVEQTPWYTVHGSYFDRGGGAPFESVRRIFGEPTDRVPWLEQNVSYAVRGYADAVVIAASDGFLGDISVAGSISAASQRVDSTSNIVFGTYPMHGEER